MKKSVKSLITMLLVISLLMSNFAMIISFAAISDYPVELAFNNIFVFDKWAGNSLSTTIVNNGVPVKDKLDINIEAGSVRFTNQYTSESYTGHGMGTGVNTQGNYQYYYMEVEPDAAYTFSYNVSMTTSFVTPYIFFFNENNEYISHLAQPYSGNGDTSFVFTAPSNAHYIQLRFTIPEKGYADFKDISIRKTDIASYGRNIYDFDAWASNAKSGKICDDTAYNGGTITKNTTDNSVTLTTDSSAATKGVLFTNFTFGNGNGYYMMDVEPGTIYNFSYNLADCNFPANYYKPYVVYYDANENYISYIDTDAAGTGTNSFIFMTPANAEYIQIVYGIVGLAEAGKTCTVKDVAIQKLNLAADTVADLPHRLVYTYSVSKPATYGELPVPTYIPDGYVFAGWYTGTDGTGELITENTPVHHSSYTVYPKYEPIVDSLSIKEQATKKSYTVGERVNPTGIVLEASAGGVTRTIDSGFYCTPEYLTAAGQQTISVHYGGKTATYTVNVSTSASKSVLVNDSAANVSVVNNTYTFASTVANSDFTRYELTYHSDAYVRGIITYGDNSTEEFFLEPSANFDDGTGKFASYVDGYLTKVLETLNKTSHVTSAMKKGIKAISFELLDNKSGDFELLSVKTEKVNEKPSNIAYADINANTFEHFYNDDYTVGIDILHGGVVTELYANNSTVEARVYTIDGKQVTKVDYADKLDAMYSNYTYDTKTVNKSVNLINLNDAGRYLQQSYYGTSEKPYEQGYYNNADWNYNPVQAGNVAGEASKVIDFEINTEENYIYVKTRPLDWSKWSDNFATNIIEKQSAVRNNFKITNPNEVTDSSVKHYGDDYVTDTYVESKYVFEDGMIKVYNRMVDYSGLPTAQTTQELPAFYTIEPLNNYVYNDVSAEDAWKSTTMNPKWDEEPEFWGISDQAYLDANYGGKFPTVNHNTPEHWSAFMASTSSDSFGIGLYSPEVSNFYYGIYPPIHQTAIPRNAQTSDPGLEVNTSYIAPIGVRTFQSYEPSTYEYYISTGTLTQIRNSFGVVDDEGYAEEIKAQQTAGSIGVPETIYMTPSTSASTTGQYFVNNRVGKDGIISVEAVNNSAQGEISVYAPGSTAIEFDVTKVKGNIGEPTFGGFIESGGISSYENTRWAHSIINAVYQTGAAQDWFVFNMLDFKIEGTGLSAGESATLEWKITIYYGDDDTTGETHYAYTTLYAPYYQSVGAAAKAKGAWHNVFSSSILWVSGVHGYENGDSNSRYYTQTANFMPMLGIIKTPNNNNPETNWIQSGSNGLNPTFNYQSVEAGGTKYHARANSISPTAKITVDTSRYGNFNQIPNFKVGFMIVDTDNGNGGSWYVSDFTGQTNSYYNGTATGSSQYTSDYNSTGTKFTENTSDNSCGIKYHDAWNKSISGAGNYRVKSAMKGVHSAGITATAWNNNFVNINVTAVNKDTLRKLVIKASSLNEANYTADSWKAVKDILPDAANELGNPTDSDVSAITTRLQNAIDNLKTVVTLNGNGGSVNPSTFEATVGASLAPTYDLSAYTASGKEGYHSAGWATADDATEGATSLKAGLMPTFFAVWEENSYTITFNANGGVGSIASKTAKYTESFNLPSSGFTRTGYTFLGWATKAVQPSDFATKPTYQPGEIVTKLSADDNSTITLYAVWSENKYTVKYEAKDGSGSIADKTAKYTESFKLPTLTKTGYTFLGWATDEFSATVAYAPGQEVTSLATSGEITLYAVWREVGAKNDSVVIDYGLPVKINILGNDYFDASCSITGVASTVENDTELNHTGYALDSSKLVNGSDSITLTYGTAKIVSDSSTAYPQHIVYTPTTTSMPKEEIFYYEYSDGANKYYASVTVIPATSIYYEESFMSFTPGKGYYWEDVGEALKNKFQAEDRPGVFDELDANNAYGYDDAYADSYTYSLGSAKKTTVDQASAGKEPTASFTFCGTGFNLYSVTSSDTGAIQVTISDASTGKIFKNFLVDTYYGYEGEGDSLNPTPESTNSIYQVPVLSRNDLPYGTYNVVIKPLYSRVFDPNYANGAGDYSIYVDSVRIFNPAGVGDSISDAAADAYLADGEYTPVYTEIRDIVVTAEDFSKNITESGYNGAIYLDGNAASAVTTYAKQGPKNELYLSKNQAVAFKLRTTDITGIADIQIGMKVVAGNSAADAVVMNASEKSPEAIRISGAHEMFRKISSDIIWETKTDAENNVYYESKDPIVIANVSDSEAIISLTAVKCAYTYATDAAVMSFMVYEDTPMMAAFAMRNAMRAANPFDSEDISVTWDSTEITEGDTATLTIVTPPEIVRVTVDDAEVTEFKVDENENKVWTYTFTAAAAGEYAFDVVLYDREGDSGEPIRTETIVVDEAPEEPEAEKPSDDAADDNTQDNDSVISGSSIFSRIIEFIRTIINFFRRLFA